MSAPPVVLTIAGTDSGGGAGVVADVRTFTAHGCWPAVAVTAVTAQDTTEVRAVEAIPAHIVRLQIDAVWRDLRPAAAKTGMLANTDIVEVVVSAASDLALRPLVVDPVMRATTGAPLVEGSLDELVRIAAVVTPNLAEAAALLGGGDVRDRRAMGEAAAALVGRGAGAALVTGGHLDDDAESPDCLWVDGAREPVWLATRRVTGAGTHGSGCVLSAAVAAALACGVDTVEACRRAKAFTAAAIASAAPVGRGEAPVDPAAAARPAR